MTPSGPRLKRTSPAQSGSIRNAAASSRSDAGPAVPKKPAPADPISAAGAAVCGALEGGVRTAYAVIDEYMRRGQDAARDIFNDPSRRGSMNNDERPNFPGGYNQSNPMAMFAEQWMMAMRAWSQAWSSFAPGGWPMPGMNPFVPSAGQSPTVTVKVSSASPVEVTANLHPGTDAASLVAEPLRAEGHTAPEIAAPEIIREGSTVSVAVKIGPKQPKGRYRSNIRRKADGSVAGDLVVVVA
jgi:hypothetical protein